MKVSHVSRIALVVTALLAGMAFVQVRIGITMSATRSVASLGIPKRNTIALLLKEIAGRKIEHIVLDDASNVTTAVENTRKLITEDKVDLVIGLTVTSNSLAVMDVVAENETPMITSAASTRIIEPMNARQMWVFKTPRNDPHVATAIAEHMANHGMKTVTLTGFVDAYGDPWAQEFDKAAGLRKLKVVTNERFTRTNTSVTGQVLKIMSAGPDAVLTAGLSTPTALPEQTLKERGYKGKLYQTYDVANANSLRVCGKDCEGAHLPMGSILTTEQLPGSNPVKKPALTYKTAYEETYDEQVSAFGEHMWDAGLLFAQTILGALKEGQPGTSVSRRGLRDAMGTTTNLATSHGVMSMNAKDHLGLDQRSRVMVEIKDGKWKP